MTLELNKNDCRSFAATLSKKKKEKMTPNFMILYFKMNLERTELFIKH